MEVEITLSQVFEKEELVFPWNNSDCNYSEVYIDGECYEFWTGTTRTGKIRCQAIRRKDGKDVTKYRKDKGTLELDLIYWFFGLNSVKKEMVTWK